jgi:hypothetical protein
VRLGLLCSLLLTLCGAALIQWIFLGLFPPVSRCPRKGQIAQGAVLSRPSEASGEAVAWTAPQPVRPWPGEDNGAPGAGRIPPGRPEVPSKPRFPNILPGLHCKRATSKLIPGRHAHQFLPDQQTRLPSPGMMGNTTAGFPTAVTCDDQ